MFLNTVFPIIKKIKYNIDESSSEFFDYLKKGIEGTEPAADFMDIPFSLSGPVTELFKEVFDTLFFSIAPVSESLKESAIDDLLEEDGLLSEQDLENGSVIEIDKDEIVNLIIDLTNKFLDLTNKGTSGKISRNLYSSIKKEAADEAKKEISDKTKKAISKVGKQILEKGIDELTEKTNENAIDYNESENKNDIGIFISKQKMYQDGKHFNKHGRSMGYSNKKEYSQAAINFAEENKSNPNAQVYEGKWNGSGRQNGDVQIVITYNNKTVIINKKTG